MRFERNRAVYVLGAALALGTFCAAAIGDEVTELSKNPNLWAAPGGDPALTRHSSLNGIDTSNVSHLQMIWSQSSGALRGHEGQPLVVTVNGKPMMYMESAWPN
ncbi:MAG: PQQ-dependent dehydrogenase, methanol/ethanol family, partial [Steroidobacteraceae bacterium]